ncbi:PREDICTED: uncharacterized protein LOC109170984 [Ipomoea nil]|uniref:uncharacterized protein LOC109170984 n=1 Tax=Ipomoea nil TaxID=35883 RepID=UPI000900FFBF|nr:PREDICTED: uncharacterized protein LOC109170984 [Ipomoea nil]
MCNKTERLSGAAAPLCLPEDIIVEILNWLPVASLLRLKCICKTWRHIIERDDELAEKHHNRATTCFRYKHKHKDMHGTTFSSGYMKMKMREAFCCIHTQKGLVLEQDRGTELPERLRIRNPATRQAVYLPVIGGTYWTLAGIFFVGKSCCKVISFSQEGKSVFEGRFRAITVGADAAWRPLNNDLLHRISILFRKSKIYSLSIGNVFHVVTMNNELKKILSVNAENERCESEEIPETLFSDWGTVKPREWDSKLSLYSQDGENNNIKIWVLQNHEWAKITIVLDYPVPFVAKDTKFYIQKPHSLHSRFINQNEDAVVVIKPTILHLKGMEAMPQEKRRPYWKEEDVLIPSSQIISRLSLYLFRF